MKRWACITMILMSCCGSFAQSSYDTLGYHLLLKAEAGCYVPAFFPYADIEIEVPIAKDYAVVLAGGPIIGLRVPSFVNGLTAKDRKGYVLNPSIKKYIFRSHAGNNQQFVSMDYLYRECEFTSVEEYVTPLNMLIESPTIDKSYHDTVSVHHITHGFTLNFGQMLYYKNLGFEFTFGIGSSFMRHTFSGEKYPHAQFESDLIQPFWQRENLWVLRVPVRYRFFYRF